jgi:hypothetical protein
VEQWKKEKKTQAIPSAAKKHSRKQALRLRIPSWHLQDRCASHLPVCRVPNPSRRPQRKKEKETQAIPPIGSKKALVQTDVTAQVTAALTAAMQRMQQDHAASMAELQTQIWALASTEWAARRTRH